MEIIQSLEAPCLDGSNTLYFQSRGLDVEESNQLHRLSEYLDRKGINFFYDTTNCFEGYELPSLLLVDKEGNLRGVYSLDLKDVDRAMVETDLLLKLENE